MTRKDYEAFASMIRDTKLDIHGRDKAIALEYLVGRMERYFAADNPRFNVHRFRLWIAGGRTS